MNDFRQVKQIERIAGKDLGGVDFSAADDVLFLYSAAIINNSTALK